MIGCLGGDWEKSQKLFPNNPTKTYFYSSKRPYLLKKKVIFLKKVRVKKLAPKRVPPTIDILKISFLIYLNNNPVSPSTWHFQAFSSQKSVEIRLKVGLGRGCLGVWVFGWEKSLQKSSTVTKNHTKMHFSLKKSWYVLKKKVIFLKKVVMRSKVDPQP